MLRMRIALMAVVFAFSGCGYGFRAQNNYWASQHITKLYIEPLINNSLRPGLELPFTTALLKEFSRGGRIKLVPSAENADGILSGRVEQVKNSVSSATGADQVSQNVPTGKVGMSSEFQIATEYMASAQVTVSVRQKKGALLWQQGFGRSKIYPASNQVGDIGNSETLINDSRFLAALGEIAQGVAADAHDLFFEVF